MHDFPRAESLRQGKKIKHLKVKKKGFKNTLNHRAAADLFCVYLLNAF